MCIHGGLQLAPRVAPPPARVPPNLMHKVLRVCLGSRHPMLEF
jgi:hypothetical protein